MELISLPEEGEDQIKNVNFELTTLGSDFDSGEDFIDTLPLWQIVTNYYF